MRFCTAINCMDGRVQEPILRWMKRRMAAQYVDMITEPGPDRIMSSRTPEGLQSIERRVRISVDLHGSRVVAIVGHHDCTGYPVSKEEHLAAVRTCVEIVESWGMGVRVLGLWVDQDWQVEWFHDTEGRADTNY